MVKICVQQMFWPGVLRQTPYLDDEDANAGRARCPHRAARNNQRTTSDRPVQTNHLAMARWDRRALPLWFGLR